MSDHNDSVLNRLEGLENVPLSKRDEPRRTELKLYSMLKWWGEAIEEEKKKSQADLFDIFKNEYLTTEQRESRTNKKVWTNAKK